MITYTQRHKTYCRNYNGPPSSRQCKISQNFSILPSPALRIKLRRVDLSPEIFNFYWKNRRFSGISHDFAPSDIFFCGAKKKSNFARKSCDFFQNDLKSNRIVDDLRGDGFGGAASVYLYILCTNKGVVERHSVFAFSLAGGKMLCNAPATGILAVLEKSRGDPDYAGIA